MKILKEGHHYKLNSFEKCPNPKTFQELIFVEMIEDGTYKNGTTNEEIINVLINRMEYLNNKFPCEDNEKTIEHLKSALHSLNNRTRLRKEQGVEGLHKPHIEKR